MTNVSMVNAANDWVRGVRLVRTCQCQRDLVQLEDAAHCTVESNYLFGTQGKSVNYGIESYVRVGQPGRQQHPSSTSSRR